MLAKALSHFSSASKAANARDQLVAFSNYDDSAFAVFSMRLISLVSLFRWIRGDYSAISSPE
jgi:hypothetical protein